MKLYPDLKAVEAAAQAEGYLAVDEVKRTMELGAPSQKDNKGDFSFEAVTASYSDLGDFGDISDSESGNSESEKDCIDLSGSREEEKVE
jgi:hypothetical protein